LPPGRSISATTIVPGAAVCTDFIVSMGTRFLGCWYHTVVSGLLRTALPEKAGAGPERDNAHADRGHDLL
jgi:hypothetical protein